MSLSSPYRFDSSSSSSTTSRSRGRSHFGASCLASSVFLASWRTSRSRTPAPRNRNRSSHARGSSRLTTCVFTGIVQGKTSVISKDVIKENEAMAFRMQFPKGATENLQVGASVAINGTCLTAVEIDQENDTARFDLIIETLRATNLGKLDVGSEANFERAARIGDEIGGHNVSGHVNCVAQLESVEATDENRRLLFSLPKDVGRYVFAKGFVAVDGCSLTVGEVERGDERDSFSVYLIPETLRVTTLGGYTHGDAVNIEADASTVAVVETVARVLAEKNLELSSL